MISAVKLEGVHFTNVDYKILEDIDLDIQRNSFTIVTGVSGSGKSTLLKIMAGILPPESGKVSIFRENIGKLDDKRLKSFRNKIGFMFQDAALLSNLTIFENLRLPLEFHNDYISSADIKDKIEDYLKEINLLVSANQRPAQLSFGEKKLVSFVRSLMLDPEMLFLDDPLSSIDTVLSKKIIEMIADYYQKKDATVIVAANLDSRLLDFCDKIILIEDKRIRYCDAKEKILGMNKNECPGMIKDFLYRKTDMKKKKGR